eukprot:80061_1
MGNDVIHEADAGPYHYDKKKGSSLKPQWKIGAKTSNVSVGGGIGDVRDGLDVGIGVSRFVKLHYEGATITDCLRSLKTKSKDDIMNYEGYKMLLGFIQRQNLLLATVLDKTGINLSKGVWYDVEAKVSVALEVSAKLNLATGQDTEGYYMVGAGGKFMAGLGCSLDIFYGINATKRKQKVIIGCTGCELTVVVTVR